MARSLAGWLVIAVLLSTASFSRAADDTGLAGEQRQEPQEVVATFLKDLAAGKYDAAYARTTPQYQKAHPKEKWKQGFTKMAGQADLAKLKLEQMLATEPSTSREARAAGVTNLLDTGAKKKLGFGFGLVLQDNKWLIRDIDLLPNGNAVHNFVARFKEVEPNARDIPIGAEDQPQPGARQ